VQPHLKAGQAAAMQMVAEVVAIPEDQKTVVVRSAEVGMVIGNF
jgi:hypothetical protein